jgi:hypothetical protein
MNLMNFIVWLSAGAVIGWLARRMVEVENKRVYVPIPIKDSGFKKN